MLLRKIKLFRYSFIFYTDTVPYQDMKESASQADALGEKVQYGITSTWMLCIKNYLKIVCHSGKEKTKNCLTLV